MRHCMLILLMGISFSLSCSAQKTTTMEKGEQAVKMALKKFAHSGDVQDAATLDQLLDDNFRIVMNQLFGSKEVIVMSKEVYLEKIKNKEFGGDKRKVHIEDLKIVGKSAQAKVTLKGSKATFISLIQLVMNSQGEWKLVSDVPTVI